VLLSRLILVFCVRAFSYSVVYTLETDCAAARVFLFTCFKYMCQGRAGPFVAQLVHALRAQHHGHSLHQQLPIRNGQRLRRRPGGERRRGGGAGLSAGAARSGRSVGRREGEKKKKHTHTHTQWHIHRHWCRFFNCLVKSSQSLLIFLLRLSHLLMPSFSSIIFIFTHFFKPFSAAPFIRIRNATFNNRKQKETKTL